MRRAARRAATSAGDVGATPTGVRAPSVIPEIAINPVNPLKAKTRFHELAHVVLGHTAEATLNDDEQTPRNLREVEAESVAILCLAALNLPGVEHCRGFIQAWWGAGNPLPERSAQRILKAADQILKAGTDDTEALS